VGEAAIRIGVLGLGSVFYGPYMGMLERLATAGRARVTAVYDIDEGKRRAAGLRLAVDPGLTGPEAVIESDDVDVVLVLTSMTEHGSLASAALAAGKHVLVEKPMATSLEEAAALMQLATRSPGHLICAPHILLSPTFRAVHAHVESGDIGRLLLARARYGWSGPDWGRWFYERGGGALFDLGVYNVTSLCALFGPAQRVTAMAGVAIPERVVEGEAMRVQAEDNAHVLIDFGEARFASVTTGFTIQKYRSPAIELYGSDGVLQLLGDDWAPDGYELWRNSHGAWELHPESEPGWQWTEGLRHLVACIESGRRPVTRPEHAYHALEIMLAAQAAAADGRAREISSDFPPPDLAALEVQSDGRRVHDPRSALI
jgi:predicted dehydrogenase